MKTVQRVRYLNVAWHHDLNDEPILLLSEINDGREVRTVEHYPDGDAQFAGPDGVSGDTHLSETLMATPGPERIVTDSDESAYYTINHFESFTQFSGPGG